MEEDGKRSMLKVMNDRCYKGRKIAKLLESFPSFVFPTFGVVF
jgi:hypothetical protein